MDSIQDFKEKTYNRLSSFLNEELSKKENREYFSRFEIEIKDFLEDFDLIDILYNQDEEIKTYWSSRISNFEIAGIGASDIIKSNPLSNSSSYSGVNPTLNSDLEKAYGIAVKRLSSSKNIVRYFACIAFDSSDNKKDIWDKFGKYYMAVPEFEFFKKDGSFYFAFNLFLNSKNLEDRKAFTEGVLKRFSKINIEFLRNENKKNYFKYYEAVSRTDTPQKDLWIKNIKNLISDFDTEKISKAVLSRKTIISLKEKADALNIMKLLKNININTYNFCFQFGRGSAFLGCSPELLFSRSGVKITSDAIAGTSSSSGSKEEDALLPSLLKSTKDSDEYKFVYDSIKHSLEKISSSIKILKKKEILQLSYLQHIYSQFEAVLNEGIDDFKAMHALHPTPAVSGYPKYKSIKLINKYEPFSRGFYCGPSGWFAADESEFAVAIRSGVVSENSIIVFSGAGIVKKSDPELEWDEIENKINPFLKITKLL